MPLASFASHLYKIIEKYFSNHIGKILLSYWLLIFILTSIPSNALPALGVSDKFKHFGAYFVLTILVRFYFHFRRKFISNSRKQIVWLIILTFIYAIFDEIHQYFIPGRYFDLIDLAANFIGIIVGIFVSNYILNANSEKSALIWNKMDKYV